MEQIYNKKENKTYLKKGYNDTLYWFDCGKPAQKMLKFQINKRVETILGIVCDQLVTYYENKTSSYYFNSDSFKINPDWYKSFTFFNKNFNSQKMKAIYLKYKVEYADFIATVTATSMLKQRIDNDIFSIKNEKTLIEEQ